MLVLMPLASCFSDIFGDFYYGSILNVPKVVVLNLSGHDFNFLNGIFLPLTVSWPCCLGALSFGFIFFGFSKVTSWFIKYRIL